MRENEKYEPRRGSRRSEGETSLVGERGRDDGEDSRGIRYRHRREKRDGTPDKVVRGRKPYAYVMCCLSIGEEWREESLPRPTLDSVGAMVLAAGAAATGARAPTPTSLLRQPALGLSRRTTFKRNAKVGWRMDRVELSIDGKGEYIFLLDFPLVREDRAGLHRHVSRAFPNSHTKEPFLRSNIYVHIRVYGRLFWCAIPPSLKNRRRKLEVKQLQRRGRGCKRFV